MPIKKAKNREEVAVAAGKSVETEMKAMKQGKLKSGRSGKKVKSRKRRSRSQVCQAKTGERFRQKRLIPEWLL